MKCGRITNKWISYNIKWLSLLPAIKCWWQRCRQYEQVCQHLLSSLHEMSTMDEQYQSESIHYNLFSVNLIVWIEIDENLLCVLWQIPRKWKSHINARCILNGIVSVENDMLQFMFTGELTRYFYRTHLIYDWMSVIKEKSCMQSNQIHYCNNKTITNKNKERSELVSKLRLWYGTMRYKSERRPITQKALCFLAILSRSIEFAMNFRLMLNKLTSNKLADDQTNSYGSQNKCCSVNWPN